MITCTACGESKETSEFHYRSDSGTYRKQCNPCRKGIRREDFEKNHERDLERSRDYYADNVEQYKLVRADHFVLNRGAYAASTQKYNASKLQQTPPWYTDQSVKRIYRLAANKRKRGLDVHVDHIIPLQGKLVSGLHCRSNLQILTAAENLSKNNSFAV